MPSLLATGTSSGPKMIKAAAPSSTEPITIRLAIDSSMKSEVPLSCDNPTMNSPTACGTCCNVNTKASDCAAATMNSTRPERPAPWTKPRHAAAPVTPREHKSSDHDGVERGEGGDLGRGGKARFEADEDHGDQTERNAAAEPHLPRRCAILRCRCGAGRGLAEQDRHTDQGRGHQRRRQQACGKQAADREIGDKAE